MHNKALRFIQYIAEQKNTDSSPIRIFCDMDGVLTDFVRGFKRMKLNPNHRTPKEYEKKHGKNSIWGIIDKRKEKFWKRLPWTKDGRELWDYLERYDPYILSSPSKSEYSKEGKLTWIKLNLGINQKKGIETLEELEAEPEKRVIFSNKKDQFVKTANDILIDDKKSNIDKWTAAGGTGILHDDSTDTIRLLEEIVSKLQGGSEEEPDEEEDEETDQEDTKESPEEVNENLSLPELKKKYPNAKLTLKKLYKFNDGYFARLDIITQGGKSEYLGALKGPVSMKNALAFFNSTLSKEYDKYY